MFSSDLLLLEDHRDITIYFKRNGYYIYNIQTNLYIYTHTNQCRYQIQQETPPHTQWLCSSLWFIRLWLYTCSPHRLKIFYTLFITLCFPFLPENVHVHPAIENKTQRVRYSPVRSNGVLSCFRFDELPICDSFIFISLLGNQNELTEKAISTWFTHWNL